MSLALDLKRGNRDLLELIVLKRIAQEPVHGYQLILYIKRKFGVYLGPSTMYPVLNRLEKAGFIQYQWDFKERPRKTYWITKAGERYLQSLTRELELRVRQVEVIINA